MYVVKAHTPPLFPLCLVLPFVLTTKRFKGFFVVVVWSGGGTTSSVHIGDC